MATTRFPNGLTTVVKASTLGQFIAPDPTKDHTYFQDFDTYAAGDWTVTTTQAGAGSSTEALTSVDGGCLLITNDDADNDNVFMQLVAAGFLMATGKRSWFKARFKVSDATQSDVIIGLCAVDTSPLDDTDGIYFIKNDDAATMDVICRKNATTGSTSAAAIATLVADTFVTVGWYWDGVDNVAYFVNDVQLGTLTGIAASYLPDAQLTVTMGIQNGAAAAKTMTVDYLMASKER